MLIIKLEFVPPQDPTNAISVDQIIVVNNGEGDRATGHYNVFDASETRDKWQLGSIRRHDRNQSVWALVEKAAKIAKENKQTKK